MDVVAHPSSREGRFSWGPNGKRSVAPVSVRPGKLCNGTHESIIRLDEIIRLRGLRLPTDTETPDTRPAFELILSPT